MVSFLKQGHSQRRRKVHTNKKVRSNDYKTRRFNANQMPDQIYDDMKTGRKNVQPIDLDLPGAGQIYCVSCAKYFKVGLEDWRIGGLEC